jgi:hypothetical protein
MQGGVGMKTLLQALWQHLSTSQLFSDVGGRIYFEEADENPEFPYIVYFIVSTNPDEQTFTEDFESTVFQFSIFSDSRSPLEIAGLYDSLQTLLDECQFEITDDMLLRMHRLNGNTMTEDITTPDGTQSVKHWTADYEVLVETDD